MSSTPPTASAEWNAAVSTGLLRLGVGALLFSQRRLLAQRLAGAPADDRVVPAMFAYFGVRDMALGVATLAATKPGASVSRAVRWQGLADTTDAAIVAGVSAAGRLSRPRAMAAGAVALGSAAAEFLLARRLS